MECVFKYLGNPKGIGPGSVIEYKSNLTDLIKKTCTVVGDKVSFKNDLESENIYRQIIEKYPRFPFGYYYLSFALYSKNDPSWKFYARRAVEILKKTTIIDGHNGDHDKILKMLENSLKQNR